MNQPAPRTQPSRYRRFLGDKSPAYVTSPEVARIVNLAVHLGRPLLVEGEAGCGKTQLAHAIAAELKLTGDAFVTATVKSTSQARDLLYRFDALKRLQDAQDKNNDKAAQMRHYLHLQPLGRVIAAGKPALVLIDEVDKADIDFPNDLLDVLDRFEFEIDELPEEEAQACLKERGFGRKVAAPAGGVKPVVIITSNREKQLPEPFLRRCLYVKLEFPREAQVLREIVHRNLASHATPVAETLVEAAVQSFLAVRERGERWALQKPPATSELVDWVRALVWRKRAAKAPGADALDDLDRAVLFKVQKDLERWKTGSEADAAARKAAAAREDAQAARTGAAKPRAGT